MGINYRDSVTCLLFVGINYRDSVTYLLFVGINYRGRVTQPIHEIVNTAENPEIQPLGKPDSSKKCTFSVGRDFPLYI